MSSETRRQPENAQAPKQLWLLPERLRFLPVLAPALVILLLVFGLIGCKPGTLGGRFGSNGGPRDVVTVFFSKYQGSRSIVEDVVRKLPPDSKEARDPLAYAMQELLAGPTPEEKSQGFYSEIPAGTKLLGITEKGDTVTINLSDRFTEGGGSTAMEQRFEQLKQTIFSNDSSHEVKVAVDGKPLELLGGEGLEVPASLKREAQ